MADPSTRCPNCGQIWVHTPGCEVEADRLRAEAIQKTVDWEATANRYAAMFEAEYDARMNAEREHAALRARIEAEVSRIHLAAPCNLSWCWGCRLHDLLSQTKEGESNG